MLNGDVLDRHRPDRAARPARAHRRARDAGADRRSRPVRLRARAPATPTARSREFVEKPGPDQIDTNLINAGAYILEREVLDGMPPAGTNVSIERDVFPALVGHGLYGYEAERLLARHRHARALPAGDLRHPRGQRQTEVGRALARRAGCRSSTARHVAGRVVAPALVGRGLRRSRGGRSSAVGSCSAQGVTVGDGRPRRELGAARRRTRRRAQRRSARSIIGRASRSASTARSRAAWCSARASRSGRDNILAAGARIFPGVELPDGAIRF